MSQLQREIKQRSPFRNPSHEATVALLRTSDDVARFIAPVIEAEAVSGEQYNVLRILRGADGQGLPTLEIASRMIQRTPGITRLLDKLEAKSLVRRKRCPEDRRQVLCWITDRGLELLSRVDEPLNNAEIEAFAGLGSVELRRFIGLMGRVRAHLNAKFKGEKP